LPTRYDLRRGVWVEYDDNPALFGFEAARCSNSDRGNPKPSDQGDKNPGEPVGGKANTFDERLPGIDTPSRLAVAAECPPTCRNPHL